MTKQFGKVRAVDDISLAVPPGAALGLVGPNGSGKSTLIKCCVGLIKPDAGQIFVNGHDIADGDIEAKRYLSYAPELPDTAWSFTPWDHLAFIGQMLELNGWETEAERLLKRFDLWVKRNEQAGSFSKGEDQKVMLAMAFLRKPRVLFLDEPLLGLDPRASLAMKEEVRALLATGSSAVICSHVLSLVEELCSGLAVLSRGRLVFIGTSDGLRAAAQNARGTPLEESFVKITEPGAGMVE